MDNYREFQNHYYESEWKELELLDHRGTTGWRTKVPAPDFIDFIGYLKKNNTEGRALDLGCGGGRHSIVLAKAGFEVYGIDFSSCAIKVAKKFSHIEGVEDKIQYRVGSALNLPYSRDFFDLINDDGCLHHISKDDWQIYLLNMKHVLKPGGILRTKVFSRNCQYYKRNKDLRSGIGWVLIPKGDYTYFFDESEIINLFGEEFEILSIYEKYHSETKDKRFYYGIFKKITN